MNSKITILIILMCLLSIPVIAIAGEKSEDTSPISAPAIVFLGDSNLWTGGEDCRGENAWSKHFTDSVATSSAVSFARSGATWTNTPRTKPDTKAYSELLDDNNVMYNQALRLIEYHKAEKIATPDIIFLAAGTNDAWFQKKRFGIFNHSVSEEFKHPVASNPAEATSLVGAVRLVCSSLRKEFPNAKLIIIGPPYTTQTTRADIGKVADMLQETAAYMRLPMIRLDDFSIIDPIKENVKHSMTIDGTHTSPAGALAIANHICALLRKYSII